MMPPYTAADATSRLAPARVGSLAAHLVTREYLERLRAELYGWIERVDEALEVVDQDEHERQMYAALREVGG